MDKFKKKNLLEKRKMAIEELVKYYAEYRIYCYNKGDKLKGIEMRKRLHPIIDLILKIDQVLSKEEIVVISNKSIVKPNESKIFACTHIGGNDIQRTFQVINEPAYLMLGDPGILYKMPIYYGLKLNGVIPLETKNRQDRKIAYNRAIELLNNGGNLLIYPEGAWNVTPNEMVMKIFTGTVRMAKETGVDIIPIAVEQYDNVFYFNVGKNYNIDKNTNLSLTELNDDLRDKLATLKWEIMETQPKLDRAKVTDDYLDIFQSEIVNRCNYGYGFSLEDAISESFHDKNITKPEEAFAHLQEIEYDINNAFLLGGNPKILKRK
jgi:putative acyltransferase